MSKGFDLWDSVDYWDCRITQQGALDDVTKHILCYLEGYVMFYDFISQQIENHPKEKKKKTT